MMTSFLRPLTLTAVATLLMTAPLAGTAPSVTAEHTHAGRDLAARTRSVSRPHRFPVTGLPTGARPRIAYAHATKPAFLGGNFRAPPRRRHARSRSTASSPSASGRRWDAA